MTKTLDELADEYTKDWWGNLPEAEGMRKSARENFCAGYQAAQEHAHAALEQAKARIQELRDQLMAESGVRLRLFKDDADAKAAYQEAVEHCAEQTAFEQGYELGAKEAAPQWISVKDRLPELNKHNYSEDVLMFGPGGMEVTHIQKTKRIVKWRGLEEVIETNNGSSIQDFTHWMPLPKPPTEE